jgi:hypothetical protein
MSLTLYKCLKRYRVENSPAIANLCRDTCYALLVSLMDCYQECSPTFHSGLDGKFYCRCYASCKQVVSGRNRARGSQLSYTALLTG